MAVIKYSKTYKNVSKFKDDFVKANDSHLQDNNRIAQIYFKQPIRTHCKLCNCKFNGEEKTFNSHDIEYVICDNCGHVNGKYQDTEQFAKEVYETQDYGKNYRVNHLNESEESAYKERTDNIYVPKVNFLTECIDKKKIIKVLDVGAGSGYFVSALMKSGISSIGIEVSEQQVVYGNNFLCENSLIHVQQDKTVDFINGTDCNTISFIGVLEHLSNLNEVIRAINENDNIKYIYFSVPMFSYSVILESIHPEVFNRQLGGTHTHLFTDDSISWLIKENNWEVLGKWYFGTDVADCFRNVVVENHYNGNDELNEIFYKKSSEILDSLQNIIDRQHFCSEVHVVVRKA